MSLDWRDLGGDGSGPEGKVVVLRAMGFGGEEGRVRLLAESLLGLISMLFGRLLPVGNYVDNPVGFFSFQIFWLLLPSQLTIDTQVFLSGLGPFGTNFGIPNLVSSSG